MAIDEQALWDEENGSGYDAFAQPDAATAASGQAEQEEGTAPKPDATLSEQRGPQDEQDGQAAALSDDERLAALFESMPTRRKVLLGALDLCREPQPAEGLAQRVDQLQALNHSVFSGATLIELLEKAGGLRHVNEDGSAYEPQADDAGVADSSADGTAVDGEPGADAPTAGDDVDSDEDCEVEFLEVEQPAPTFWVTTEAGLAALEADDPRARLEQLLEDDAEFVSAYREILEALADGPLAKPQIDVIVKANASAQAGHRLGGYFVDRLEKADAIEWTGAWTITDLGRSTLDLEALYR